MPTFPDAEKNRAMLTHHPLRHQLVDELHARPFTSLTAPAQATHIAFKHPYNAAERAPSDDFEHLAAFMERHGGPRPAEDAQHFFHDFGDFSLKWERHTEFVTYSVYVEGEDAAPFSGGPDQFFPRDWLNDAPGLVVSAVHLHVEKVDGADAAERRVDELREYFNEESLAAAYICEKDGLIFGDFRIAKDGFTRFVILECGELQPDRLGRAAQRIFEVEHYRAMAMLALPSARGIVRSLSKIDDQLSDITATFAAHGATDALMDRLTSLSTELEKMSSECAFRFGAAGAYAAIVNQRVEIMREERVQGAQLFSEFMIRRFHPAMRTCRSAEKRLEEVSSRASRAANLLRTRINLSLQEQNRKLLVSMNKRAGLQLRLQETVELLSFVAICYSGVGLLGFLLAPVGETVGLDQSRVTAMLVLPVITAVLLLALWVRRRQKRLESEESGEHETQ